jgi:hypothetical protein
MLDCLELDRSEGQILSMGLIFCHGKFEAATKKVARIEPKSGPETV